MPVSQTLAYQLYAGRRCIPLPLKVVTSSYVVGFYHSQVGWRRLVPRVARDFVSRLGRLGHDLFSKNGWLKPSLEVHV